MPYGFAGGLCAGNNRGNELNGGKFYAADSYLFIFKHDSSHIVLMEGSQRILERE